MSNKRQNRYSSGGFSRVNCFFISSENRIRCRSFSDSEILHPHVPQEPALPVCKGLSYFGSYREAVELHARVVIRIENSNPRPQGIGPRGAAVRRIFGKDDQDNGVEGTVIMRRGENPSDVPPSSSPTSFSSNTTRVMPDLILPAVKW